VSTVPRWLALLTLPAGAVGPALLAIGYPAGAAFAAGAVLVSLAVAAFAVAYGWLFLSTDRSRVGFYGPLGGVAAGLVGVGLGLQFASARIDHTLVGAHLRLNVLGLLGLSIAGVVYQFYPPAVGSWPGAGDRLAFWSLAGYAAGLPLFALEPVTAPIVGAAGHVAVGSAGVALLYLLLATIRTRTARR
jgi:hypothetical protein